MHKLAKVAIVVALGFSSTLIGANCIDSADSYNDYDRVVKASAINNLPSSHYLLSYSWAPSYCAKASVTSKKPGEKNYLQCGGEHEFGYILHGLWPQGTLSVKNYPRACLGDQAKIERAELKPYLCMTPSYSLLQHEYENHGTCMPTAQLRKPEGYFGLAQKLHSELTLPQRQLPDTQRSYRWWYQANPGLPQGSVQYASSTAEWRICFDAKFNAMACVGKSEKLASNYLRCTIKGNISKRGKKYFFDVQHRDYATVKINNSKGERCFNNTEDARAAGWQRAP